MPTSNATENRSVWVAPAIVELDIAETANLKNNGADGAVGQPDFTKS